MANYEYLDDTGVIVPDTGDLLATVQGEFKNAFGQDLVVTPDTPQGVLITAEALARDSVVRNNAAVANQINPNLAGGTALDAICSLTGLDRIHSTQSTVTGALTGIAGTIIPAGSTARTAAGDVFATAGAVVLDGSGNGTANFISVAYGPIPAAIGALSFIVSAVLGWEGVTNAAAAVPGQLVQSDQALRALRKNTLATNAVGIAESIITVLYETPGVKSLVFRENYTDTNQTFDTVTLIPHSVYACVAGGTDVDVATALLEKKSGGCAWNGTTTVTVTEAASGQPYDVKFSRPTPVTINVRATVSSNSTLLNPATAVPAAILAYANGEQEGEPGLIVGQDVSPYELAGAVERTYPGLYVQNMELSTDGGSTWVLTAVTIHIDQIASITAGNIIVLLA